MSAGAKGFTILEVVIALFLISVGVIATAPLFVFAVEENAAGNDLTTIGTIATAQLERMRGMTYFEVLPGGSLDTDVDGYFDDSNPDYLVRWRIQSVTAADLNRRISVRVMAFRGVRGEPKEITVVTMRGI